MRSSLIDIRTEMSDRAEYQADQSTQMVERLNRFINRAQYALALDAPYLFYTHKYTMATQPDVTSTAIAGAVLTDRMSATVDPFVLIRNLAIPTGATVWPQQQQWNGREVEIADVDGQWHRRVIRDVWTDGANFFMSLDRPWRNATDTDMEWRVTTPRYFLPADVIYVSSISLWDASRRGMVDLMLTDEALELHMDDVRGSSASGIPMRAFRESYHQLEGPAFTPFATLELIGKLWTGPDPAGDFEYCFTYAVGKRDIEFTSPTGNTLPLWESAPSPVSATVSYTYGAATYDINLPDSDWVAWFGDAATTRYGHSGVYKRIYRRRLTAVGGSNAQIETKGVFHFLDEVDGLTTKYTEQGIQQVDTANRLIVSHGNQTFQLSPIPDARYDMDIRVIRRPTELVNDYDAPRIVPEAMEGLILRALMFLQEHLGNVEGKLLAKQDYERFLSSQTKNFGALPKGVIKKKFARPGRNRGYNGISKLSYDYPYS